MQVRGRLRALVAARQRSNAQVAPEPVVREDRPQPRATSRFLADQQLRAVDHRVPFALRNDLGGVRIAAREHEARVVEFEGQ
jgi:hypothetical protein